MAGDEHRRLELEPPARPPCPRRAPPAGPRPGRRRPPARRPYRRRPASAPWPRAAPASPTTFNASTGNTQGIRLRISPPRNASPSMRCRLHRRRLRRHRAGGSVQRDVGLQAAPVADRQDARQPVLRPERLARPQRQREPAVPDGQRLGGTVADGARAVGNEPGVDHGGRRQLGALHQQRSVAGRPPPATARAAEPAGRTRRTTAPAPTERRPGRQIEPEVALLRDADLAGTPASSRAPSQWCPRRPRA